VRNHVGQTQYRLKATLALGYHYGDGPTAISTCPKEESIPIKFPQSSWGSPCSELRAV
jgi:hypothetical protein